ncbi:hypothetical protein GCM10011506_37420 [Marivirga lumbricoides]|uniref:PKD domain-containing protein n=1 Tax=Marivirga lumbricoides TaxID=1046115 RepID=A0ABQ1MWD5_9BACT|nr:hypothetical protein GCM10011506_37420 [Marivirga lumbricoides]
MKTIKNLLKPFLFIIFLFSALYSYSQQLLEGTVLDEKGEAVPLSKVKIFSENEDLLYSGFTGENGEFVTDLVIKEGSVTATDRAIENDYYLSCVYPNPINNPPVYFKYRSQNQSIPAIKFYNLSGKEIREGTLIEAGTYLYKAKFNKSGTPQFGGLLSVSQAMKLQYEVVDIGSNYSSAFDESKAANLEASGMRYAQSDTISGTVRVEIEKSQFITLSELINTDVEANISKIYELSLAPKPTASFEIIMPDEEQEGEIVKFDASASSGANNEELIFSWSFGDSTRGGQMQIPHIYSKAGTYSVSLTVTGAYGARETLSKELIIKPEESNTGTVAIRGIITDTKGEPLQDVRVFVPHMDSSFVTNEIGEVAFDGFISGKSQMLEISKTGFISEYYNLQILNTARQGYFELSLIERAPEIIVQSVEYGATATGSEGVQVKLPVEGLVHSDGSIVTGDVEIYMTALDVSDDGVLEAFPGTFSGITFEGEAPLIMTFGTVEFTFMQNGEELQVAAGKTATIDIPIYVENDVDGTALTAGEQFPMWFYDESSGNWVQDGTGTVTVSGESPTGFVLRGEVSHFSWWNHDIAPEPWYAIPECKIEDKEGLPTLDIPNGGACFINGKLEGPTGPRGNPSTPNCCQPLACPPDVPIIFAGSGGNGIFKGSVTASGAAGTTTTVIITMNRVAGYGEPAGEIAPDTTFTTAIEEANSIDAFTVNQEVGEKMLLSVGQANGSTLEGTVEIRDPDNLPIEKRTFGSGLSAVLILEVEKTGDYQIIVDGTANEPGAYVVSLSKTQIIELNSNAKSNLAVARGVQQMAVNLDSGQLFNLALATTDISGRLYLNLFDPSSKRIYRQRGERYISSGVIVAEHSGVYLIQVEGVDSDSNGEFTIGLSGIEEPQLLTPEVPYTLTEGTLNIIGEKQYYKFTGNQLERKNFAIHSIDGLTGRLRIRRPGEQPFYKRNAISETYRGEWADLSYTLTLPETGEYIIEIETYVLLTNELESLTGNYEAFIFTPVKQSIDINSQIKDELTTFFDAVNEFRHYTFTGSQGQVINVARITEFSGRNTITVFDSEMTGLKSTRDNPELGYVELPADGPYVIEINGVDRERSQGEFTLGLTTIDAPQPISFTPPFSTLEGSIDVLGRHKYYSINVDSLERYNVGLSNSDTLRSALKLLRYDESREFYKRTSFKNVSLGDGGARSITYPYAMPFSGELIFEVEASLAHESTSLGAYELYLAKREEIPIDLNTIVTGTLSRDLDAFNQIHPYLITSPASNQISVSFTYDVPETFPPRIYIAVYSLEGEELYRKRTFNSDVITLPSSGNYIMEIESVDGPNNKSFSFIVNEE